MISMYFSQPDNELGYAILVVKTMEVVEDIKGLKTDQKYLIAVRCITETIQDSYKFPAGIKKELISTIPSSIDAIISLSKGQKLNVVSSSNDVVETAYVTKRSVERIVKFIRTKKYSSVELVHNIFMITSQVMFIVGSYPSLSGKQKREIVINVIKKVIGDYRDDDNKPLAPEFVDIVLTSLPTLIDIFVKVSKNKFYINKIIKKCFCF